MTMVLSCSWTGEYTNETLLHLKWGEFRYQMQMIDSPFNWKWGGNVNEIDKWLWDWKYRQHQWSSQWSSSFASGRSTAKATVSKFHYSKRNIELFFDIFSERTIIINKYTTGRSSNCVSGHGMLFSSKGQLDPFAAWHMMEFSSVIQRWISHSYD